MTKILIGRFPIEKNSPIELVNLSRLVKDLIWDVDQVGSAAPYLLLVGGEATYLSIGGVAPLY